MHADFEELEALAKHASASPATPAAQPTRFPRVEPPHRIVTYESGERVETFREFLPMWTRGGYDDCFD